MSRKTYIRKRRRKIKNLVKVTDLDYISMEQDFIYHTGEKPSKRLLSFLVRSERNENRQKSLQEKVSVD